MRATLKELCANREAVSTGGVSSTLQTGEDNGDAHLKNLLLHHQVVLPITTGRIDFGPWQRLFYCEFDGQRSKRVIVKVIGE